MEAWYDIGEFYGCCDARTNVVVGLKTKDVKGSIESNNWYSGLKMIFKSCIWKKCATITAPTALTNDIKF